ncbi:predicted protein [Naegleria gruberi]|uniref:Predicted protein n=1 Tax=Naegleria gruberi TaxID=5762 RepID=D2VDU9_NAEGR|nr:uncharacterized protein NAEGRDRAFT_60591 [Naegleria gruberi]EFC44964.1 predicted protein [Naegleria gruberi]|eukprot:XP_002677708.1 predicted protein [Naegleria gruberi strain NEG-M]
MSKLNINSRITLNDGTQMPIIGLGTWRSEPQKVKEAVIVAIESGYRHIDCAALYGNEKEIGEALEEVIKRGVVKREELWITSKIWNTHKRAANVRAAFEKTLSDLKLEYLDQYLIHWPIAFEFAGIELKDYACIVPREESGKIAKVDFVPFKETWGELEKLVEEGKIKSIGISNFSVTDTCNLYAENIKIKPAVNQIEAHPYFTNTRLMQTMKSSQFKEINTVAYCPLGRGGENAPISDPVVIEIAQKYSKSPAQVVIRWALQRGSIIVPKSVTPERIKENINVFDFELNEEDMNKISELGKKRKRAVDPIGSWGISVFED